MTIPKPGSPVRGSQTGAPVMAIFDLLGRRWAMGIVWQLKKGACTFRELQERCGDISPSILNSRIKDLKEAKIVDRSLDGYTLTDLGVELSHALEPIGKWSVMWSKEAFGFEKNSNKH